MTEAKEFPMKHLPSYLFCLLVLIGDIFYIRWVFTAAGRTDTLTLVVVSGLVAGVSLIVFWSVGYHIAALRKGTVTLQLPERVYEQGEVLQGTVHLQTHTDLAVQGLQVTFYAIRKTRDEGRTYQRTIWQRTVEVLQAQPLQQGTHTFDFAFTVPHKEPSPPAAPLVATLAGVASPDVTWYLAATLEVPGADLTDRQRVRVNDGAYV